MKKTVIKFIIAIAVICLLGVSSVFSVFGAASTTIYFSNTKVNVGDTVTVTVKVNVGEPIYAIEGIIDYDRSILSLNADSPKFAEAVNALASYTKSYTFKAVAAGNVTVSVGDISYVPESEIKTSATGASALLKVAAAGGSTANTNLSKNADLASITAGAGTLTPNFSSSVTSYTVTVPYKETDGTLAWKVKDANAKATVSGNRKLEVGANIRKITVTAQDGTQKVYTVKFIRLDENGNNTDETNQTPQLPNETANISINIGSKNYYFTADTSNIEIPEGLGTTTFTYNETECPAFTDKDGKHYFVNLTSEDGSNAGFFEYSEGKFKKIVYANVLGIGYIINEFPSDIQLPAGYESVTYSFNGYSAAGVSKTNDLRYIIFYAESQNGTLGYYRYDKDEGTMQRYDEFNAVLQTVTPVTEKSNSFLDKLSGLNKSSLIVLCSIVLAALIFVAIIVLLIILIVQNKKENTQEITDDAEEDEDVELTDDTPKNLQEMLDETFSEDEKE